MSAKYTCVETEFGGGNELDYLPREEAIANVRAYWQYQIDQATRIVAELDAGRVKVYHQTGVYVIHNRREVAPA